MRYAASKRLIPARAGNTYHGWRMGSRRPAHPLVISTVPQPAHPRSRGEHLRAAHSGFFDPGSSPLARGTQKMYRGENPRYRLIPARAGNTFMRSSRVPQLSAHPRSRGEHFV